MLVQPWGCSLLAVLCYPLHLLWKTAGATEPDTSGLQLGLVPSLIPTITEPWPMETWPSRDVAPLALTGPRSDQAWREGSGSSPTSARYYLWAQSKREPWLDSSRQCLWKLPSCWATVAWKREEQGQSAHKRGKWKGGWGAAGGHVLSANGKPFHVWPRWITPDWLLQAITTVETRRNNSKNWIHCWRYN